MSSKKPAPGHQRPQPPKACRSLSLAVARSRSLSGPTSVSHVSRNRPTSVPQVPHKSPTNVPPPCVPHLLRAPQAPRMCYTGGPCVTHASQAPRKCLASASRAHRRRRAGASQARSKRHADDPQAPRKRFASASQALRIRIASASQAPRWRGAKEWKCSLGLLRDPIEFQVRFRLARGMHVSQLAHLIASSLMVTWWPWAASPCMAGSRF